MSERYYRNVEELTQADNIVLANELLKQGWELLKISELIETRVDNGQLIQNSRVIYVLGKIKEPEPVQQPPVQQPQTREIVWEPIKNNPKASWTFRTDKQGNELPEIKELADRIRENGGKYTEGKYVYKFSGDNNKFIMRVEV